MKRFTVPCDFNGVKHPFHVYIGEPHPKKHPLQFQAWWLSSERGGTIPQDVMDSFEKLFKISQENQVSFEDLCVYALGTASEENEAASTAPADASIDDATGAAPMDTPGMENEGAEDPFAVPTTEQAQAATEPENVPAPQSGASDDSPRDEFGNRLESAPAPAATNADENPFAIDPLSEEAVPKPKNFEDE